MWARDRGEQQRVQPGGDDRPAGREAVGGRAGRGGHHDPVGGVAGERPAVAEADRDRGQPLPGRLLQDDVVDGQVLGDLLAVDQHAGGQGGAPLDPVPAGPDGVEGVAEAVGLDLGQEPEPAGVDPQRRHLLGQDHPERPQQGAVPAERHHQVEPAGELVRLDGRARPRRCSPAPRPGSAARSRARRPTRPAACPARPLAAAPGAPPPRPAGPGSPGHPFGVPRTPPAHPAAPGRVAPSARAAWRAGSSRGARRRGGGGTARGCRRGRGGATGRARPPRARGTRRRRRPRGRRRPWRPGRGPPRRGRPPPGPPRTGA